MEPLTTEALTDALKSLDGWDVANGALESKWTLDDFPAALAFLVQVGFLAESQGHHPEITNVYNQVTLRLRTHDAGDAITDKDVGLARAINQLR